ncbi:MAG: response regulator, partial [Bacteroidales bacterium]|nr:response regulator [Bacteroidales bacterium]
MDKILYIDDEPNNLKVFQMLFLEHFTVFVANNTAQGYQFLLKEEISVVITDQRMPNESGLDFIERVQSEFPEVVFMILSGYSDFEITIKAINSGHVYRFIQKPWQEKELLIDINNAIERYKFLKQNKQL